LDATDEPDGTVVDPAFFLDPENAMDFSVTVDLSGVAAAVLDRIDAALAAFASTPSHSAPPRSTGST